MTKVLWLPNETDYSYCEFLAPNAPYWQKGLLSVEKGHKGVEILMVKIYKFLWGYKGKCMCLHTDKAVKLHVPVPVWVRALCISRLSSCPRLKWCNENLGLISGKSVLKSLHCLLVEKRIHVQNKILLLTH